MHTFKKYRVYNPETEGEEDAEVIEALNEGEAAEIYVSSFLDKFGDSWDLMVLDSEGVKYDVTVEVDWSPMFMSYTNGVVK
jgi:hypothetical protein